MTLQTLENISLDELLDIFNGAFADYIVPFRLTREALANKIVNDHIRMDLSVGAFENGRLTGFILHGYGTPGGIPVAYNAGTGVLPEQRGKRLTNVLYTHLLPVLRRHGIREIRLEVITGNKPAIHTYETLGFRTRRTFDVYRGRPVSKTTAAFELRELEHFNPGEFSTFWDWEPSWQNAPAAVENTRQNHRITGAFEGDRLLAYIVHTTASNRVPQFAVRKTERRRGLAGQLFAHVAGSGPAELTLVNVDASDKSTQDFLENLGLSVIHRQYEMCLPLEPDPA